MQRMPSIAQKLNKSQVPILFYFSKKGYLQIGKFPENKCFFEYFVAKSIAKHKVQIEVLHYILASFTFGL